MDMRIEPVKEKIRPVLADFYKKSRKNFISGKSKSLLVVLCLMRFD